MTGAVSGGWCCQNRAAWLWAILCLAEDQFMAADQFMAEGQFEKRQEGKDDPVRRCLSTGAIMSGVHEWSLRGGCLRGGRQEGGGIRIDPARRMMLAKLGGGKVRGLIKALIKVLIIAGHNDI